MHSPHKPKKAQGNYKFSSCVSPERNQPKKTEEPKKLELVPLFDCFMPKKQAIPYFQNNIYKSILKQSQNQPSKQKSNPPHENCRLAKIRKLLKQISNQHEQMKAKVEHLKSFKQNEEEQEFEHCTFAPQIKHNPRYTIRNNMEDRNKSWDEARVKHYTSIKQQIVQHEVKECTFNPYMEALSHSKKLLKKKELRQNRLRGPEIQTPQSKPKPQMQAVSYYERIAAQQGSQSGRSQTVNYNKIRRLIRDEMGKIKFEF